MSGSGNNHLRISRRVPVEGIQGMSYDAAGFRHYREIRKLLGNPVPDERNRKGDRHKPDYKRPYKKRPYKKRPYVQTFRRLRFVGWDGEGITDEGETRNRYVMLSNSNRECLRGHDLSSEEIFEFLLEHRGSKRDVHCVYGAVYDFTHWFLAIPDELKKKLHETGRCDWKPKRLKGQRKRKHYFIEYTPRKSFKVEERSGWSKRFVGETFSNWKWRNRKNIRSITVWDVIGFFQQSFVSTLRKWDIGTREQQRHIAQMKENRRVFARLDEADILEYNFQECELLAALMGKLHQLLLTNPIDSEQQGKVWLPLKRWDGAGAVASAIYRREGIKAHLGSSTEFTWNGKPAPDWHYRDKEEQAAIEFALRSAYFGGRIECFRRGRANAPGFDLDVISAYPAAMLALPSFAAGGRWHWRTVWEPESFGVWQVEWTLREHHQIGPLPYRLHTGTVIFPECGAGWYHTCEVRAAVDDTRNRIHVIGGWVWVPANDAKPFAFVERYFDARVKLQAEGHAAEKVLKLGLNSLYGKMAQTLGSVLEAWECKLQLPEQSRTDTYIEDCSLDKIFERTAAFYNLAWAGAVTATCRSTIYREAIKRESEVCMIQTDGLFCTLSTPGAAMPEISREKKLGGFELAEYDDSVIVQAGVYYLGMRGEEGEIEWGVTEKAKKTRGFSAEDVDVAEILRAWQTAELPELEYQSKPRFQTLGYAMNKRNFKELACWQSQPRIINLYFDSKRTSLYGFERLTDFDRIMRRKLKALRLHQRQLPTVNFPNTDYLAGCPSRPCNPKWREKLHETGEDDFALTESEIEGDDYVDNAKAEILADLDLKQWQF
jgi:DNA polymerase type B, organellar and viral